MKKQHDAEWACAQTEAAVKAADVLTDGSLKYLVKEWFLKKKKRFSTDLRKGRKKNIIVTYFDILMDTV